MSAGTAETEEQATSPLDYTTPAREAVEDEHFNIDGEPVVAHKPKIAVLALMGPAENTPAQMQMEMVTAWMPHVFDTATQQLLSDRLDDPEDDFDVPSLVAIGRRLLEHWSDRPTGPQGGSRKRSSSTTRRSTGRSR